MHHFNFLLIKFVDFYPLKGSVSRVALTQNKCHAQLLNEMDDDLDSSNGSQFSIKSSQASVSQITSEDATSDYDMTSGSDDQSDQSIQETTQNLVSFNPKVHIIDKVSSGNSRRHSTQPANVRIKARTSSRRASLNGQRAQGSSHNQKTRPVQSLNDRRDVSKPRASGSKTAPVSSSSSSNEFLNLLQQMDSTFKRDNSRMGQRIDAVERNLRVNIEPIVYNEINLLDFNGSTPQKYALKVLAGLHGAELKNYILTDELQRRSLKTPIPVEEKSKLMQAIQRKFQLSALVVNKYWPRIKIAVNSKSRFLAHIARKAEKLGQARSVLNEASGTGTIGSGKNLI